MSKQQNVQTNLATSPQWMYNDIMGKLNKIKKYRELMKTGSFTRAEATRMAGYSVQRSKDRALDEEALRYILEREGLTQRNIAKHIADGMKATKRTYVKGVDDFVEEPDWSVRHKYLSTLLELKGEAKKSVGERAGGVNITVIRSSGDEYKPEPRQKAEEVVDVDEGERDVAGDERRPMREIIQK